MILRRLSFFKMEEMPELKPIRDIATRIAFQAIVETSEEDRATRRRMAHNLKLSWEKYRKVEEQVLKIMKDRENAE